jgi:hypothetical protein
MEARGMNEEEKAELWTRLNELYEMARCGEHFYYPYTDEDIVIGPTSDLIVHTPRSKNPWSTYPCRKYSSYTHREYEIPWLAGLALIKKNFLKPRFAFGCSPRKFRRAKWIGWEYDFQGMQCTEDALHYLTDRKVLDIMHRNGIHPHFTLSGNRSIHVSIFNRREIAATTIHSLLKDRNGGLWNLNLLDSDLDIVRDEYNLVNCLRLPLSYHQETGRLCLFAGTEIQDDVIRYLQDIQQDDFTEEDLLSAVALIGSPLTYYGTGGVVVNDEVSRVGQADDNQETDLPAGPGSNPMPPMKYYGTGGKIAFLI